MRAAPSGTLAIGRDQWRGPSRNIRALRAVTGADESASRSLAMLAILEFECQSKDFSSVSEIGSALELHELAANEHRVQFTQIVDVLQGISVENHQIRQVPGLQSAALLFDSESGGTAGRERLEHTHR